MIGDGDLTVEAIAAELGVKPEKFRRWLNTQRGRGDARLRRHVSGQPWLFDPGTAFDLRRQFASEYLGIPDPDIRGPHGWRNWRAFTVGRPARTTPKTSTTQILPLWEEYALYSDVELVGDVECGPHRMIATHSREPSGAGRAAVRIVLRTSDHLAEPGRTSWNDEGDIGSYFGGDLSDEFAALLSLALTCRVRSGGVVRAGWSATDLGTPIEMDHRVPVLIPPRGRPMLPGARGKVDLSETSAWFERYRDLCQDDAVAVARAASQFSDGLWLADSDPRLAWIKLVGALESAANRWDGASDEDPIEQLRRHRRRVFNAIKDCGETVVSKVARDLAGTFRAERKFKEFVLAHDPGPPTLRPTIGCFDWSRLENALGWIYEHRSRDLHGGVAFPVPLCEPPIFGGETPAESFPGEAATAHAGQWPAEQLPLYLHAFVYIAGGALRKWWQSLPAERSVRPGAEERR